MGQVVICQPTANFSFTPIFHSRKISFQTSSLLDLCILWPSPLAFIWSWIWFQKSSRKEKYFSSRRSFFSREVEQVAESSGSSMYTLFASWQPPLSELVAHCWYLLIIFSIPTCRCDPTTSHDYQAGERDYRWCLCETMVPFSSRPSAKVTSTKTVTYISNICSVIQIATQLLSQCICQAGSQYLLWIAAYCYLTKVVKNITSDIFREKYRTFSQIWPQMVASKRLKIEYSKNRLLQNKQNTQRA